MHRVLESTGTAVLFDPVGCGMLMPVVMAGGGYGGGRGSLQGDVVGAGRTTSEPDLQPPERTHAPSINDDTYMRLD